MELKERTSVKSYDLDIFFIDNVFYDGVKIGETDTSMYSFNGISQDETFTIILEFLCKFEI